MPRVLGLDHVSIIVKDADQALAFYQGLLGVNIVARPNLGFPGYWLDLGVDGQTIHLMQLDNPNEHSIRPEHGGRDYHFALRVNCIDDFMPYLESNGIRFTRSQSGRKALFIKDLDNNALELFEVN